MDILVWDWCMIFAGIYLIVGLFDKNTDFEK